MSTLLIKCLTESMGSEEEEPEILLTDLLKTIQAAKTDERIKAIVLDLSSFGSGSMDKLGYGRRRICRILKPQVKKYWRQAITTVRTSISWPLMPTASI